jgi:SAM-dependent methyltransferase
MYDSMASGMEKNVFAQLRSRLVEAARGRVLDVGAGTGANLPHYRSHQITELVLLDPDPGMLDRALRKAANLGMKVAIRIGSAEKLPFADGAFDSVIFTLSLCTIPDPARALREARRVLAADGKLLVLEHVRARDIGMARWQSRLNPIWGVIASGCHLDRDTLSQFEAAGFVVESADLALETALPYPLRPRLLAVARKDVPASPEVGERTRSLAAHPAEELLDFDAVEAAHDRVVAHAQQRNALAVELLPLAHGDRVAVDPPVFEGDAQLVQQLDHRGRVA